MRVTQLINKNNNAMANHFVIDDDNGETAQDIDATDTIRSYMSAISRNKARAQ